ncbi:hypothetical protein [Streptomyces sp. NEAU-H3]|nr:hypothetical protein [Streptomyces sp. NEAU-H3]
MTEPTPAVLEKPPWRDLFLAPSWPVAEHEDEGTEDEEGEW